MRRPVTNVLVRLNELPQQLDQEGHEAGLLADFLRLSGGGRNGYALSNQIGDQALRVVKVKATSQTLELLDHSYVPSTEEIELEMLIQIVEVVNAGLGEPRYRSSHSSGA